MTEKQRVVIAITGVWAIVFTALCCLMMGGAEYFHPGFHYGNPATFVNGRKTITVAELAAINNATITETVKCILLLFIAGLIHRLLQRWLTMHRPEGNQRHPGWGRFDLVTSFLPVVASVVVFAVMRLIGTYESWWWWLQGLYFLIILYACWIDVWPTYHYWRRNRTP